METSFISTWINAVTHPKETFAAEKPNSSVVKGLAYYFIAYLTGGIIGIFWTATTNPSSLPNNVSAWGTLIGLIIGFAIILPIITLFLQGIIFILAKLLGGKGTIIQQYYLVALYSAPLYIIGSLIGLIPFWQVNFLLQIIIFFYSLYLTVLMLKETHIFSLGKAVMTLVILVLVFFTLAILLSIIIVIATGMPMGDPSGLIGLI